MGLASETQTGLWTVHTDAEPTLRAMGEGRGWHRWHGALCPTAVTHGTGTVFDGTVVGIKSSSGLRTAERAIVAMAVNGIYRADYHLEIAKAQTRP